MFTGKIRATEVYGGEVSPLFQMTYAFVMSVFAAILAEARGDDQRPFGLCDPIRGLVDGADPRAVGGGGGEECIQGV